MRPPNIIYIHSHDTGRYVQPYGHAIPTPHLQELARSGILFRHAYSAAPTCSPSRAALLTGQSPHSSGMLGLAHRGFQLHDYGQHIIHTLRGAGYTSILAGVQHLSTDASELGFDTILEAESNHARHVAEAAAGYLRHAPDTPFFMDIGFFETHREFPELESSGDKSSDRDYFDVAGASRTLPPAPLPDTPETRADMLAYHASAQRLDDGVGKVLAALDAAGLRENTLVIYTTDHGLAFPFMKCNLTDHGIGVSLIMHGPAPFGGDNAGTACHALISQIDVFPTLCEWLSITPPAWLQGRSFLPVLQGETDEVNEEIFAEVTFHAAYEPQRGVRTRRYKYIRRYGERTHPVLTNCDDSPSKDLLLRHGWRERALPREALYDLMFDPQETHNLVDTPAYADVREQMRTRLNRWMLETDDPLLMGPVFAPSGALVNDPDGLSPKEPPREMF